MVSETADLPALLTHAAWLRRLAISLVRDADVADDVVQGTWVAAWQKPPTADRNARPWLAEVARNQALNLRRGESRRRKREVGAMEDPAAVAGVLGAGPSTSSDPEELVAELEIHRMVAEVVAGLTEPYRTTLVAHFFDGEPLVGLAGRLGIPAGTVRWRLKEGLDRVRAELDRRNEGDRARWQRALTPLIGGPAALPTVEASGITGGTTAPASLVAASAASSNLASLTATQPAAAGLVAGSRRMVGRGGLWLGLVAVVVVMATVAFVSGRGKDRSSSTAPSARERAAGSIGSARPIGNTAGSPPRFAVAAPVAASSEDQIIADGVLRHMLQAISNSDYDRFLDHAEGLFKARFFRHDLTALAKDLAPRLRAGFDLESLGPLRREGHTTFIWKLTFRNGGDDLLASLSLADDKVVGFFLQ